MYRRHFKENKIESIESQRWKSWDYWKTKKFMRVPWLSGGGFRVLSWWSWTTSKNTKTSQLLRTIHHLVSECHRVKQRWSPCFYLDIKNCKPYYASASDLTAAKEDVNGIYWLKVLIFQYYKFLKLTKRYEMRISFHSCECEPISVEEFIHKLLCPSSIFFNVSDILDLDQQFKWKEEPSKETRHRKHPGWAFQKVDGI